jgi:predicted nucleic acid-binding Zn ribbon protein
MKRKRLHCSKCGARKSKVEIVEDKVKATCTKCKADIPLYKDAYGKYHPGRDPERKFP